MAERNREHQKSADIVYDRKSPSHKLPLNHSVSLEEKRGLFKKKTRNELENEHIVLDSAKLMVEEKLRNANIEIERLNDEKSKLKSKLNKIKDEKQTLIRDLERSKYENERMEKGFDLKKNKLQELQKSFDRERELLKADISNIKADSDVKIRDIKQKLTAESKDKERFIEHFAKLLQDRGVNVNVKGSPKNIQIGNSNTGEEHTNIVQERVMTQWKDLTEKLCSTLENHKTKRKDLEMKFRNNEVLLKEMKTSLDKVLDDLKKAKSKELVKDRELIEFLTSDRSDERIFTDGMKQFKAYVDSKQKGKVPLAAEALVTRLLNKFGDITCCKFVAILEGNEQRSVKPATLEDADQTELKDIYRRNVESIELEEKDKETTLTESKCMEIVLKWIALSKENNAELLLKRIYAYESTEMDLKYQEEINNKDFTSESCGMLFEGSGNISSNETQRVPGLPDILSQFMHQLEGLSMMNDMKQKVDEIHAVVTNDKSHQVTSL